MIVYNIILPNTELKEEPEEIKEPVLKLEPEQPANKCLAKRRGRPRKVDTDGRSNISTSIE